MQTLPYSFANNAPAGRILPDVPQTIRELGLPETMVVDLALRYLRERGSGSLTLLRKALKLSFGVVEAVFQQLRQQQLLDLKGSAGQDFHFTLTSAGRALAAEKAETCRYAGPAPVPLDLYTRVVQSQRAAARPSVEDLQLAFRDLVMNADTLDELGMALTSGRPIFLYGPSGNGKTSIIERLPRLFLDTVLVPYALEVDGHVVSMFDPAVHVPVDIDPDEAVDQRWVRCYRPCVVAGGELVPESLSLRLDHTTGIYAAPLQMKASNGVLAIDDFGRQIIPPRDLFNRWILPLDRRIDHLSLEYGFMFRVPFEVCLVFSTNLKPAELADEAFIRRVPNKIYLGPITPEAFDEIFHRTLARHGLPPEPELAAYLRALCREKNIPDLRACYPGDICSMLVSLATYERRPFAATPQALARAAQLYFLHSTSAS